MSQLPCPTEAQEAHVLVAYLRTRGIKFVHVPNETGHSEEARRRAIRVKREGGSKGFPDYLCLVNGSIIAIELKRVRGSKTSPEQIEWIESLNEVANVQAFICKGAAAAIEIIEKYSAVSKIKTLLESHPKVEEYLREEGWTVNTDLF